MGDEGVATFRMVRVLADSLVGLSRRYDIAFDVIDNVGHGTRLRSGLGEVYGVGGGSV